MTRVTLLYFASVREAINADEEAFDLPEGVATPRAVMHWLSGLDEGHALAFAAPDKLRCAVDQVMTTLDAPLGNATELAFFPPVTGG